MRIILVLCLLALMSCQRDIIDIAKCLYESPKVQELIGDAIVAIVTKDFSKLLAKIKESLPELIQVVINCVTTENETNLKGLLCTKCIPYCDSYYPDIFKCYECRKKYCPYFY